MVPTLSFNLRLPSIVCDLVTGQGEKNGAFLLAWGWSPISVNDLGLQCRVWGDSHSRRRAEFINYKTAEVPNVKG